jgi:lipopolysaccharide assembly outer membrane protein LptD (OstA)
MISQMFRAFRAKAAMAAMLILAADATLANPSGPASEKSLGPATFAMQIQADAFISNDADGQMIAKGGVEVHYKLYVLRSDQLVYDQKANELKAIGNVRIAEPDAAFVTADRITLIDDFRDAFLRSFQDASRKPR